MDTETLKYIRKELSRWYRVLPASEFAYNKTLAKCVKQVEEKFDEAWVKAAYVQRTIRETKEQTINLEIIK